MYGSLEISTSGMVAQRVRLEAYAANLANRDAITNEQGQYAPFHRRIPILSTGDPSSGSSLGVHVSEIREDSSVVKRFEPGSPFADNEGYVGYPDISPEVELMNSMEARRSYEANIAAAETAKSMINSALQLLA